MTLSIEEIPGEVCPNVYRRSTIGHVAWILSAATDPG